MIKRLSTIELSKESFHFSAAHFTIFGDGSRERLHGHNFTVFGSITGEVGESGMIFDYCFMKKVLREECARLDEFILIPGESSFLTINDNSDYMEVSFQNDKFTFPKNDVLVLPIRNTTLEELSWYILQRLLENKMIKDHNLITEMTIKVSSGPGQFATASYSVNEH